MESRKRNEFLDAEESEDEQSGYISEDESRSRQLPNSKRRKLNTASEREDEEDDNNGSDNPSRFDSDGEELENNKNEDKQAPHLKNKKAGLAYLESLATSLPSDLKLQSTKLGKQLSSSALKKDKSGVIYLSRVPPFMKPTVLRSLLAPYGALGRVFLTPETSTSRTQRLRSGGTRRKLYLDGWVEFIHKRDAKHVAESLNAQIMGGKKRGRWHDEIWNIKYLSGVKWSHLVEQIQNENAERTARLRFEIQQEKKENKAFLENIEKGKVINGIEATRRKRADQGYSEEQKEEARAEGEVEKHMKRPERREFIQHTVVKKALKNPEPGQDVYRVLSSMM